VELLEKSYAYALDHGLADLSLRPLATAIGSSPRVLLFLFGSKDGLLRALLARARADELAMLADLGPTRDGVGPVVERVWDWLVQPRHRPLLTLWVEGYARSLIDPDGAWSGFAKATVEDWLAVLASAQPATLRRTRIGESQRTLALAVLRGAILDLLATGDAPRITATVKASLGVVDQLAANDPPFRASRPRHVDR
jgi:AcrR family transcriptional regulator